MESLEHLRQGEEQVQRPWGALGPRSLVCLWSSREEGLAGARLVRCEGGSSREGGGARFFRAAHAVACSLSSIYVRGDGKDSHPITPQDGP